MPVERRREMKSLKTLSIAVFVAAVTAASVVWYIDYKINQVTVAMMAPVHASTAMVNETIADVQDGVQTTSDAIGTAIDATGDEVTGRLEGFRADVLTEWETAQGLADSALGWMGSLRS